MANSRPPVELHLDYGVPRFSPDVDELVRQLAALVPRYRVHEMFDWLNPPPLSDFKAQLQTEVDRLTKELAVADGNFLNCGAIRTNRWTRAAGACFATSLVRRRVL